MKTTVKNIMVCSDYAIGDKVTNIQHGRICDTYPLDSFLNYKGQERNNLIKEGVVLDIHDIQWCLKTLLIEKDGAVCCVRYY
jgi:hypothetical protein